MHVPLDMPQLDEEVVDRLISNAREMRDLTCLKIEVAKGPVLSELAEQLASAEKLVEFGFTHLGGTGGRFRQESSYDAGEQKTALIEERRDELQTQMNEDVLSLYENLSGT